MMSRHSSISSARIRLSHSSPKVSKPESIAPRPDRQRDATVGQPVDGGDLAGELPRTPARRWREQRAEPDLDVRTAARPSEIQASTPHTGSQTKSPSHPASSAASARSPMSSASPQGTTKPNFMPSTVDHFRDRFDKPSARVHVGQTRVDDRCDRSRRQGLDLGARAGVPGVRLRPPAIDAVRRRRHGPRVDAAAGSPCSPPRPRTCAARPDPSTGGRRSSTPRTCGTCSGCTAPGSP